MHTMTRSPLILLSQRVYRMLLILYPAEYRREYGEQMAQVFRDVCRDAYRQRGLAGIIRWWCKALLDLTLTALEQRRKAGISMSNVSTFWQRISGVLLIAGGLLVCLASGAELQPGWNYPLRGIYQVLGFCFGPALFLIALGTTGIVLKYPHRVRSVGRLALYGAASGALVVVAYLLIVLTTQNEYLWNMFLAGFLLHAASLIVFGMTAQKERPLPRLNGLPMVIGAIPFVLLVFNPSANGVDTEWENIAAFVAMGIGYAALGYVMLREPAKAAVPLVA